MKLILINPRNRVSLYGDYLWQPLAFGYVAAATPPHWDVELIDEQCEGALDYSLVEADLVGVTPSRRRLPAPIRSGPVRARGIPVVIGASMRRSSEEAAQRRPLFIENAETPACRARGRRSGPAGAAL